MGFDQFTVISGLVAAVAVIVTTIVRQGRFESSDIGSFIAAFMGGCNIPAAIFLCSYGFSPDPPNVSKLFGYEKYVSLAGVALLCLAAIGVWTLLRKAYEQPTNGDDEVA